MAGMDRIINIDDAIKECTNCVNHGLRMSGVKTKCATCIYYDLLEQIEVEENRLRNLKKDDKMLKTC